MSALISKEVDGVGPSNSPVIVSTILAQPYTMMSNYNDRYEGFIPDLVSLVCEKVGIECELKLVSDGHYGERRSDGTWNGMIGEITGGEADMTAAPLTVTSLRMRVVSFTVPFLSNRLVLIYHKSSPHNDIQSILDDPRTTLGTLGPRGNYLDWRIETASRKLMDRLSIYVRTTQEGIEMANHDPNFYLVLAEPQAYYIEGLHPCSLKVLELPQRLGQDHYAFALPFGSPYFERVNLAMQELHEHGYIQRLYKKWWMDKTECVTENPFSL
jgi:ABC-type amino acid transport substrate-binding protein